MYDVFAFLASCKSTCIDDLEYMTRGHGLVPASIEAVAVKSRLCFSPVLASPVTHTGHQRLNNARLWSSNVVTYGQLQSVDCNALFIYIARRMRRRVRQRGTPRVPTFHRGRRGNGLQVAVISLCVWPIKRRELLKTLHMRFIQAR